MTESTAQNEPSTHEPSTRADQSQRPIEVDVKATETDSAYGNEFSVYSASLTSSVLDYRHENGRRYHGYRDGSYLLPNDDKESDRLDMIHEMTLTVMERKLFLAPIGPSPQRVIDLGTGTGIWAIDFADQYPSAEVIGVDLSPTQPSMVPPNLRFLVDDIEAEWAYESPFDFIHARYLAYSIKDFKKLLKQCFKYTKPGGWVEFQDWDSMMRSEDGSTKGSHIERYSKEVLSAFEKAGYPTQPGPNLEQWFREAGFVDIHVQKYRIPMGPWPKDPYYKKIGTWNLLQGEPGFESAAIAVLTRFESWSPEEVKVLAAQALNDVKNPKIHPLYDYYVVYGRKPE
ncbi:hypothetical protein VTN96DRAFT_5654 [Rasamsonia emersonii]|uniref:S-adenosyl-L-methionine-dependent methyltransferase n=1 Tax=Rasamsonia emersonii (strain ATCC 16479 / CBS 393.64 / IMI 116815) TaxID=1408163 RepID=A0A0F4YNL2_RASE3|nr:hypothetical protein T310_6331 [Rasamsonia emersonii CBS 393.64]KKA19675.1 hypothetical protein T310_6331 [Rasamsonia emersonii CBS 393.64]